MTSLNPAYTIGSQMAEVLERHRGGLARRRTRPRRRTARPRRHHRAGHAPRAVSAPAFRRPAPAGDDLDGADVRAGTADRRRTHHRARCHRAGADPPPAADAAARTRPGAAADHPRPRHRRAHGRPRLGHVCRRGGGKRDRRRAVRRAYTSVYTRPAALHPGARQRAPRRAAGQHPRRGAAHRARLHRLRLPRPLRARHRRLRARRAAPGSRCRRTTICAACRPTGRAPRRHDPRRSRCATCGACSAAAPACWRRSAWCARWTAYRSRCPPATCSASSASPAAANRRWRA